MLEIAFQLFSKKEFLILMFEIRILDNSFLYYKFSFLNLNSKLDFNCFQKTGVTQLRFEIQILSDFKILNSILFL